MDLMDLLPPVYENNTTMQELQGILTSDINTLAGSFDESINECFLSTTTALLSRYETIYGLNVDVTKSTTSRRERIMAKAKGIGTTTKQMIIDTAAAYSGGEVEVIEDPANSTFIVKFIGTIGIPANIEDFTMTIEEIKPAHLSYTLEYTYKTWNEVSGNLWGDVSTKTWYELATE